MALPFKLNQTQRIFATIILSALFWPVLLLTPVWLGLMLQFFNHVVWQFSAVLPYGLVGPAALPLFIFGVPLVVVGPSAVFVGLLLLVWRSR